ncbi:hypothetical protein H5410_046867 [Solanum commersonii]|uniref:Uncharacterized protein n=1 Tax=Solanum commersonii TaxID=4109 RepID=A0A9J5XDE9_SOLCO|nr:hypothetical protein H5410_046867 [Solanum commersonii]
MGERFNNLVVIIRFVTTFKKKLIRSVIVLADFKLLWTTNDTQSIQIFNAFVANIGGTFMALEWNIQKVLAQGSGHQLNRWTPTILEYIPTSHGLFSLSLLRSITQLIRTRFKISQIGLNTIVHNLKSYTYEVQD